MNAPITFTTTVACWVSNYNQRDLLDAAQAGDGVRAVNALVTYGAPDREKFADYIRVGEADITVRLLPKEEQSRRVVQALQEQLNEERIKWHERQEAILAEISKWSAIEYEAA